MMMLQRLMHIAPEANPVVDTKGAFGCIRSQL